jgi:hypothetical protein
MAKKIMQCSPLDKKEAEQRIAAGDDPSLYFIEVDDEVKEMKKKKD